MIIYPNGSFATRQDFKNDNFADEEWKEKVLVIDDDTDLGQQVLYGRKFEVILENEKVIDINLLPIEPPKLTEEQQRLLDLELAIAQILGGGI